MHAYDIQALIDLSYVVLALLLLLVAKVALGALTPFDTDDELSAKDNPAFGLSLIGYYLGVTIVFLGAIYHDPSLAEADEVFEISHFAADLGLDALWALGAILLLNAARVVLDRVVLSKFSVHDEIVRDRNVGMGAVEFGTYVSSALVVAGAVSGEGSATVGATIGVTAGCLALGLGTLIVFALLYQRLVGYDLVAELEADNPAAGVAYGGVLVALGLCVMRGSGGTFVSWPEQLERFAFYAAFGLFLIVIARRVIDGAFLTGRTLHEEIAQDRNVNAGYLEGGLLIGLAAVVAFAT